jgi:hypothetical protein
MPVEPDARAPRGCTRHLHERRGRHVGNGFEVVARVWRSRRLSKLLSTRGERHQAHDECPTAPRRRCQSGRWWALRAEVLRHVCRS